MPSQLGLFAAPSVAHFPVTSSFWRGCWSLAGLRRPLRRACDWALARPSDVSFASPTCADCKAYRAHLVRHGRLKG